MREFLMAVAFSSLVFAALFSLPLPQSPSPQPVALDASLAGSLAEASPARQVMPPASVDAHPNPGSRPESPSRAVEYAQATSTSAISTTSAVPAGDGTHGRDVYRKCQACHSLEPGKSLVGPSLAGIFGKKAGSD